MKLHKKSHISNIGGDFGQDGFATVEIMLAVALLAVFVMSIFSLSLSLNIGPVMARHKVEVSRDMDKNLDNYYEDTELYTNEIYTDIYSSLGSTSTFYRSTPLKLSKNTTDTTSIQGQAICSPYLGNPSETSLSYADVDFGPNNYPTDIIAKSSYVLVSADGTEGGLNDLYSIDASLDESVIMDSINTGPGVSSIVMVKDMIYMAVSSTLSQLQVVDVSDLHNLSLISQTKVISPNASTTAPYARSIFYRNGYIYLGTEKWQGPELIIFDTNNPDFPVQIGSMEVGSVVTGIFVDVVGELAYISTAGSRHLHAVDVLDKANPVILQSLTLPGETAEGKVVKVFGKDIYFGRTTGGFNIVKNPEYVGLNFTNNGNFLTNFQKDISGGVYDIYPGRGGGIILTGDQTKTIRATDVDGVTYDYLPLDGRVIASDCSMGKLYILLDTLPSLVIMDFKSKKR